MGRGNHPTRFLESVSADIDRDVVPLVEAINAMGFPTLSSCQGDPGIVDDAHGGHYGHVSFQSQMPFDDYMTVRFTFGLLRSYFKHVQDDVHLEVTVSEQLGYIGWIYFRNESLNAISEALLAKVSQTR
jgi:hypothetical protein